MTQKNILLDIPHRNVSKHGEQFSLFQLGIYESEDPAKPEMLDLVELQPNAEYKPHIHKESAATLYIVLGSGTLLLGDEEIEYSGNLKVHVPANTSHGFKTKERTLFLSIQCPPILDHETGELDLFHK